MTVNCNYVHHSAKKGRLGLEYKILPMAEHILGASSAQFGFPRATCSICANEYVMRCQSSASIVKSSPSYCQLAVHLTCNFQLVHDEDAGPLGLLFEHRSTGTLVDCFSNRRPSKTSLSENMTAIHYVHRDKDGFD